MKEKLELFYQKKYEQSKVKTAIVVDYFSAWQNIMKSKSKKISYIDLYSGPGCYEDGNISTPIKILKIIESCPILRKKVKCTFNDKDKELIKKLRINIDKYVDISSFYNNPIITNYDVHEKYSKEYFKKKMNPTLSFIDPLGYKGITKELLINITKDWGCDSLLFFNYNRINMAINNDKVEKYIVELFGEHLNDLRHELTQKGKTPYMREKIVLNYLKKNLPNRKILSFKFIDRKKDKTSHFLLFITKSPLAIKIMKDIMAKHSGDNLKKNNFAYDTKSSNQLNLFHIVDKPINSLKSKLLKRFSGEKLTVENVYYADTDLDLSKGIQSKYTLKDYKEALRILESEGKISCTPIKRPIRNNKITMANDVKVKFP